MFLKLKPATSRNFKNTDKSGAFSFTGLKRLALLDLFTGPRKLLSSQLSARSSSYIMLLCIPAIALFFSTTVPALIFDSPQQEAYFYFAQTLSRDLSNGFTLCVAVVCMILALVVPAAESDSYSAIRR